MRRDQLEHLLRAASQVVSEPSLLVIGSQAILGTFRESELPAAAVRSIEADIAAFDDPDDLKADQIDGALGEGSTFHEQFAIYAQGVSVHTAILPRGWEERLIVLESPNTHPGRGLCLERHDCVLSKLVRWEQRDREFASALFRAGLLETKTLSSRIDDLPDPVTEEHRDRIRAWLRAEMAVSQRAKTGG